MNNFKTVVRWVLVLPAALLGAALVAFPVHWVVMLIQLFGTANDESFISVDGKTWLAAIPPEVLERFGYAFFTPFVMVYCGAWVAPKFKFETGIALAVLWGLLFGAALTFVFSRNSPADFGWFRLVLTIGLGIGGIIFGLYKARKIACA